MLFYYFTDSLVWPGSSNIQGCQSTLTNRVCVHTEYRVTITNDRLNLYYDSAYFTFDVNCCSVIQKSLCHFIMAMFGGEQESCPTILYTVHKTRLVVWQECTLSFSPLTLFWRSTFAPFSNKTVMVSSWPATAAWWRGIWPFCRDKTMMSWWCNEISCVHNSLSSPCLDSLPRLHGPLVFSLSEYVPYNLPPSG